MARDPIDNSLSDLSFDFLDWEPCTKDECPSAKDDEAAEAAATAASADSPAPLGVTVRPGRAPRRRLWNALDVLRTILIGLVVFAVGSLVLTMAMNPDLTFAQAVSLLIGQVTALFT